MILLVYACLALLAVFILQMFSWPSPRTYWHVSKIPGPKGLPLLGVALEMRKFAKGGYLSYIGTLVKTYKGVVRTWVFGTPIVYLSDPKYLEVLMPGTSNTKKGMVYEFLPDWLGDGLLLSHGNKWKMRRRMLTPAFHFKILEDNVQTLNKNSIMLCEKLKSTKGEPISVASYIKPFSLDVICETAMGVSLDSQKGDGQGYLKSTLRMCEIFSIRATQFWLFRDWMFYLHKLGFEFRRIAHDLHDFTNKVIEDRVKLLNDKIISGENITSKAPRPFLDNLIEYANKNPGEFSYPDIREEVDTFMFAGYDTTSTSISFILFVLGTYIDVQEKVVAELNDIFGKSDRSVDLKDIQQMTYTEKVIKESLRLYTPVPLVSRTTTEDLKLDDGLIIPPGVHLIIPTFYVHRNPESFPDPEKFDPERFSEGNPHKRHPMSYIPFSAGPRNCIGQKFALVEIKIVLATILRNFHIESVTKIGDFNLEVNIILQPTVPLRVKFIPRDQ